MFLLKQTALAHAPPKGLDDGIVVAQGLLNTVHIVRGSVTGGELPLEYTNWAVIKVPNANATSAAPSARFYYRTYDNLQWKLIDLAKLDFTPGSTYPTVALFEPGLGVRDATPRPL